MNKRKESGPDEHTMVYAIGTMRAGKRNASNSSFIIEGEVFLLRSAIRANAPSKAY